MKNGIQTKELTTKLGPTGKEFQGTLTQYELRNDIGIDYSSSAEDEKYIIKIFEKNKEIITEAWKKLPDGGGLAEAIPLQIENNKSKWFIEKRDGNPHTIFIVKEQEGKPTNLVNLIHGPDGTFFTVYPGIPPKVINFSLPAVLYIPSKIANKIKNNTKIILK